MHVDQDRRGPSTGGRRPFDLSIECASDDAGVALSVGGAVSESTTWSAHQTQSVTLLPNIDALLTSAGRTKRDIGAVFVDIGPGGYAGLRVGVSVAKALAHALAVPLAGIGRLELDAWLVAGEAAGRRIVAVHRAGRGDFAWAAYHVDGAAPREESPPRIDTQDALAAALRPHDILTGDVDETLAAAARAAGTPVAAPAAHRVVALAALGRRRLDAGSADDPAALVPLYLRGPAIGPPRA
ncbi:MAG: tRNA (adenosine(37)-N6)-threonylcarbamoyltransferase complex dimerization subunit type 1 TsaB [Chloroflexota bacterium]|nr:tRNA (adenosine(37)-N6)-threonylcarbamoyltransferase complex dimerization subunit type 1 TsaB [Chloroflexota bacterium]